MLKDSGSFPVDSFLPELCRSLSSNQNLILQAEPGAGKTTRVPLALVGTEWLQGRKILMLEPRRVAAVHAARFMAASIGERVGETIGYSVRYQRKVSKKTRIEIVTEGILTRRLQNDPELADVGLIIFDEFHERNIQGDLGLALALDVQQGLRDDLKLLVMSATLDADPLIKLLGNASVMQVPGRSWPVDVTYLFQPERAQRRDRLFSAEQVARGVKRALAETTGDILVFLPGAREIRHSRREIEPLCGSSVQLCELSGARSFREQQAALEPSEHRKIILATNIAESSLTIDGVSVVVDSGLERRANFDPEIGETELITRRISVASATQRAGRAGRQQAGHCYRLWSEGVQGGLIPFAPPEIERTDPTSLLLTLADWGVSEMDDLSWLSLPSAGVVASAKEYLTLVGALDPQGRLTGYGAELAKLPIEPRLGAIILNGRDTGMLPLAIDIIALLGERDILRERPPSGWRLDCDLSERLNLLQQWRQGRRTELPVDHHVCQRVDQAVEYWQRYFDLSGENTNGQEVTAVVDLLLAGFPDRVAKRVETADGKMEWLSYQGKRFGLSATSRLDNHQYLIAASLRRIDRGGIEVMLGSALDPAVLTGRYSDQIVQERKIEVPERGQPIAVNRRCFGSVELSRKEDRPKPEELTDVLLAQTRRGGLVLLRLSKEDETLLARLRFLSNLSGDAEVADFSEEALLATLEEWLLPYMSGIKSVAQCSKMDIRSALLQRLGWQKQQQFDQLVPERIRVPSGSNLRIDYGEDVPVLRVKLQEMFGCDQTPTICDGKVPLMIHLLSPAGRPLQMTRDLKHFWQEVYPEVKKEMKGRYPKHQWPDNPYEGVASSRTKKRLERGWK